MIDRVQAGRQHRAFLGKRKLFPGTPPSPHFIPSWQFSLSVISIPSPTHFSKFPDHTLSIFRFAFVLRLQKCWIQCPLWVPLAGSVPPCKSQRQVHRVVVKVALKNWEGKADDVAQKSPPGADPLLHKRTGNKTGTGRRSLADQARLQGPKLTQPFSVCVWQFLSKLQMYLPFDSTIPLAGIYLHVYIFTNTLTHVQRNECLKSLMTASFPVTASYEQPLCPSLGA